MVSRFDAGGIGWSWTKRPCDGDGSLFLVRSPDGADGYRAAYQEIGRVTAGLEVLQGLTPTPTAIIRGRKLPPPVVVLDIVQVRGAGMDVARREVGAT